MRKCRNMEMGKCTCVFGVEKNACLLKSVIPVCPSGSVEQTVFHTSWHFHNPQLYFNVLLIFLFIGTHGTGLTIGNIASLVTKLKFVNGKGEVGFWP